MEAQSDPRSSLASHANRKINPALEEAVECELKHTSQVPNKDIKKLRRTVSNRLSSQRYRTKKSQHIYDMKKKVKDLEAKITALTPQIEIQKEQRQLLQLENDTLQKIIEIKASEARASEMLLEHNQLEICRLKELLQTVNNNSHVHDRNSCQESTSQPYGIEFNYESGSRDFESNQFIHNPIQLLQLEPRATEDQERGFLASPAQEDEDIDQYLNFKELNVDTDSVSN